MTPGRCPAPRPAPCLTVMRAGAPPPLCWVVPRVWRRGGAGAVSYDHLQPSARLQAATAIINIDLATAHAQLPRPGHTIIPPPTADMLLCPAHKLRKCTIYDRESSRYKPNTRLFSASAPRQAEVPRQPPAMSQAGPSLPPGAGSRGRCSPASSSSHAGHAALGLASCGTIALIKIAIFITRATTI